MTGLFAQKKVTPLPVDSTFSYGKNYIVYALPQTAFKVNVTLTCSHEFSGIYSQYAEQLLGISHAISRDGVVFSVKNIDVQAVTVPDTMCMYAVELSASQMKKKLPLQLKVDRTAAGMEQEPVQYVEQPVQIPDFFRYYSDLAYSEQTDNYTETQLVDGVLRQVPAQKVQKVAKSQDKQAQDAADKIGKIREDRYDLLIGSQEVAYPAATLEAMLQNLNEMEKNYLSLFTGCVVDEEIQYTVVVIPDSTSAVIPLFSVSSSTGFNPRLSPKPEENFYLQLETEKDVAAVSDFAVKWSCSKGHKANTGYRIRIPKPTRVALLQGKMVIRQLGVMDVFQYGSVEVLPLNQNYIDIERIGIVF